MPTPTTIYGVLNNAEAKLLAPYNPGDSTITIDNAAGFSASPSNPIRLTATHTVSGQRVHFALTGVTGNTLNIAVIDGYTDIALSIGDKIGSYICRETITDILARLAAGSL